MENVEFSGDLLRILLKKLNLPTTAEFCRKTNISRGLVDKLLADKHNPRRDTLQKIKNAFPQTNMNWLISGQGEVLVDVLDGNEFKLLELYQAKLKSAGNQRTIEKFFVSVDYFVQDYMEMEEMENNATAQHVIDKDLMLFRMELLLFQYRRRLVSNLLEQVPKSGSLLTSPISGLKEKYSDLLDHLNNEILKTIKLITEDAVDIPEEKTRIDSSEIYHDEDLSSDTE